MFSVGQSQAQKSLGGRMTVNFQDAITAHTHWKMKLASYIAKPDHSLNAFDLENDNKCQLGQWLHGEGHKYSAPPEFSRLLSDHARFHRAASEIVKKADAGQRVTEDIALGARSEFASASAAVVKSLMEMNSKV